MSGRSHTHYKHNLHQHAQHGPHPYHVRHQTYTTYQPYPQLQQQDPDLRPRTGAEVDLGVSHHRKRTKKGPVFKNLAPSAGVDALKSCYACARESALVNEHVTESIRKTTKSKALYCTAERLVARCLTIPRSL